MRSYRLLHNRMLVSFSTYVSFHNSCLVLVQYLKWALHCSFTYVILIHWSRVLLLLPYNEIQVITTYQRFLSLAEFLCSYCEEQQRYPETPPDPPGDCMPFESRFRESNPGCIDAPPELWLLGQPDRISFRSGKLKACIYDRKLPIQSNTG